MLPITLFFYGFLAACAGLLLQTLPLLLFGDESTLISPGIGFILAAAFFEELAKFGFLFQAFRRYGNPSLSLVSLLLFGLGFAVVELLLLTFRDTGATHPFLPLLANTVLHASTTLILGFALRHLTFPHPFLLIALLFVTLLHGWYNLYRLQV